MDSSLEIKSNSSSPTVTTSKKLPFSSKERELIDKLVRDRPIIENKKLNAKTNDLKKLAWDDLTIAFNEHPFVQKRSSYQLKRCWENIKTLRKKVMSRIPCNLKKNGAVEPQPGGSTSSDNLDDILCPFVNIMVPGDSHSLDSNKTNKVKARIKGGNLNIDVSPTETLDQLRTEREKILIKREQNQLLFEEQMHKLQLQKIKLEIEMLKQNRRFRRGMPTAGRRLSPGIPKASSKDFQND